VVSDVGGSGRIAGVGPQRLLGRGSWFSSCLPAHVDWFVLHAIDKGLFVVVNLVGDYLLSCVFIR
jgi:hypothetical protein